MSAPETDIKRLRPVSTPRVELVATTTLPTRHGEFDLLVFQDSRSGEDYTTLVHGEVEGVENVPVRLHSECLTGDIFGSLRCDCGPQLHAALDLIGNAPCGILIYLPQEGRGIGLANKIRAYALQDQGLDTVEANHALGFANDLRSYEQAAEILQFLGVVSIAALTNNPDKIEQLEACGIKVSQRIPLIQGENPLNERYLDTKRDKCGHLL